MAPPTGFEPILTSRRTLQSTGQPWTPQRNLRTAIGLRATRFCQIPVMPGQPEPIAGHNLAPKELPHTVIPTAFVSACLLTHVTKGGGFNSRQSSLSLERAVAAMKVRAPDRKWSVFSGFSAFQMRMGGRLCLHPMGAAISNRNTCRNLLQYRSLQLHPSTAEQLNCFF